MDVLELSLWLLTGSFAAGLLGALSGMGGGVVLVPMLVLGLGVDMRYAVGASLVSVIATSSGAASAYVRHHITNLRVGMLLEVATTLGAVAGASAAHWAPAGVVAVIFGAVLLLTALLGEGGDWRPDEGADPIARRLRLDDAAPGSGSPPYHVRHVPGGFGLMFVAGVLSGLLGIGSGALKVLAMDRVMRLPFRVSTATSNFMIGVTAAASAGVYLNRGYVDPGLAAPVMIGVLAGSLLGARLLLRIEVGALRTIFRGILLLLAAQMMFDGWTGRL